MKTAELTGILQKPFSKESGCGVYRIADEGWDHVPFVVPPAPPQELRQPLPHALIAEAMRVISKLPSLTEMNEVDRLINNLFIRREVVQSSRLEGTWSTIDHALTPTDLSESGQGPDEHVAVRGYAAIMDELIEEAIIKKEKIYSLNLIERIHRRIVEHDPKSLGTPGKLRTPGHPGSIVTIGGLSRKEDSLYNPAPPQHVKRCLTEYLAWLKDAELAMRGDAGSGLSLPVRLAIGHSHFEAIHPFTDGNGRTGRTLWAIQMVCAGTMPLYLSGYVEAKKADYVRGLEMAQKKLNYVPLIEFISKAIIESHAEFKVSKKAIMELPEIWQERGRFRKNSAAERALDVLLYKPIITSKVLQEELGISGPASTQALKQLVDKKVIKHRKFEKRLPLYAAEELIHILSRPFGSEAALALEKARTILGF